MIHPWVGSNYPHQDKRILLLGESHYGDFTGEELANLTINCVEWLFAGQMKHSPFFRNLSKLLEGDTVQDKWSRVAFHNLLDGTVGPNNSHKVKQRDLIASLPRLWQVLEELKPTHMLVLGNRTWMALPGIYTGTHHSNGVNRELIGDNTYRYSVPRKFSVVAAKVVHPSVPRAWPIDVQRDVLNCLLEKPHVASEDLAFALGGRND
jgi:hypothetical protein